MSNTMDILSAQQEVAGQRQLNKEEARRLKQLSLKLEQEKKVINQHRATLEKDKEVWHTKCILDSSFSKYRDIIGLDEDRTY